MYSMAEEEYRRIGLVKWKNFLNKEPMEMSTDEFWASVMRVKPTEFGNVAKFVLSLLISPISNAIVERVFSIAGVINTKSRCLNFSKVICITDFFILYCSLQRNFMLSKNFK